MTSSNVTSWSGSNKLSNERLRFLSRGVNRAPVELPTYFTGSMNHRLKRVNELLKREISLLLQKDFVFENALVTVNGVEIAPDLRQAMVYIGIIGPERNQRKALAQLESRRVFIQGKIAKRVTLRETPQLMFRCDDSVERGSHILSLIDDIDIPDELPPATEDIPKD